MPDKPSDKEKKQTPAQEPALDNWREESDRMMKDAERQKACMPLHGELIGGG